MFDDDSRLDQRHGAPHKYAQGQLDRMTLVEMLAECTRRNLNIIGGIESALYYDLVEEFYENQR